MENAVPEDEVDTLLGRLYRFDCPSPHEIGDYELGLLDGAPRVELASHILACSACTDELTTLRGFMRIEAPAPAPGVLTSLRRVVATLFVPPADVRAFAPALRGAAETTVSEYRAGTIKVTLSQVVDRRRGVSIDGLVIDDAAPPEQVANQDVRLVGDDGTPRVTQTDAGGNFVFEDLQSGRYQIEIRLQDTIIAIDPIDLGS